MSDYSSYGDEQHIDRSKTIVTTETRKIVTKQKKDEQQPQSNSMIIQQNRYLGDKSVKDFETDVRPNTMVSQQHRQSSLDQNAAESKHLSEYFHSYPKLYSEIFKYEYISICLYIILCPVKVLLSWIRFPSSQPTVVFHESHTSRKSIIF